MKKKDSDKIITLFKWIWQSYLKTALIPLILVELVFVAIYFMANSWFQKEIVSYLKQETSQEFRQIAKQESDVIQQQISSISNAVEMYSKQTGRSLSSEASINKEDSERLTYSKEGIYYTKEDTKDGGAAVFYSGIVPVGKPERSKVGKVLTTQNLMKDIIKSQPLAASIYFNTFDSLNVIYPYFDAISQYAPLMDIPSYNFYYEADKSHNPEGKVKWTEAYLDPAGHGWMASAIAPVYTGEFLQGVVGIDVTVDTIASQILKMEVPLDGYGVLVGKDGTILALPSKGEKEWGLTELTDHHYEEAIKKDTFKPDEFNIYKRTGLESFAKEIADNSEGFSNISLSNQMQAVSWSTVSDTGWKLLIIVPEENIYSRVNEIKYNLFIIGTLMIAGLIFFYCVFFYILARKARKMSLNISQPLLDINNIVERIGEGQYYQEVPEFYVKELNDTVSHLVNMGQQLGDSNSSLLETQSQLKKREISIIAAKEEAEKASKAKSQFLSSMSHELRTPLNAIIGFSQVLEMDTEVPLNEVQDQSVREILKAGNHLLNLINEVLDLSKVESGKMTFSIEPVETKVVMEETVSLIQPFADKNGIKIKYKPLDDNSNDFVLADKTRIKQVLINLLSNAVKYNKEQGEVIYYYEKLQNTIRFNVVDTGYGISKKDLDDIFKPFHRLNAINNSIEGTGIGLTVAKQLMESMNGEVHVESKKDIGSHFYIELPIAQVDYKIEELKGNSSEVIKNNSEGNLIHKILYVEDNPANLKLIEKIISRLPNVEMFSAQSGELSIDLARAHKPNVILLDINLPGIDGFEVFKRLQGYEETKDIPVIAVSANAMESDIEKGLAFGFHDYITKPINVSSFLEKVSKVLKER